MKTNIILYPMNLTHFEKCAIRRLYERDLDEAGFNDSLARILSNLENYKDFKNVKMTKNVLAQILRENNVLTIEEVYHKAS